MTGVKNLLEKVVTVVTTFSFSGGMQLTCSWHAASMQLICSHDFSVVMRATIRSSKGPLPSSPAALEVTPPPPPPLPPHWLMMFSVQ